MEQSFGIDARIDADAGGDFIATHIAEVASAPTHPPDRRMKEEQAFNGGLQKIADVVPAADMRELMCEDSFKLIWRPRRDGAYWNYQCCAPDAHGKW